MFVIFKEKSENWRSSLSFTCKLMNWTETECFENGWTLNYSSVAVHCVSTTITYEV